MLYGKILADKKNEKFIVLKNFALYSISTYDIPFVDVLVTSRPIRIPKIKENVT